MNKLFSLFGLKTPKRNEIAVVILLLVMDIVLRPFNAIYWMISSITGWQFKGIYVSQRNPIIHAIAQRIVKHYGGEEPPAWAYACFYTISLKTLDMDVTPMAKLGELFKADTKELIIGEMIRHEQTHCHQWMKEGVLFNYTYATDAFQAISAEAEATVNQLIYYKELADKLEDEDKEAALSFLDKALVLNGDGLARKVATGGIPCRDLLDRVSLDVYLIAMDEYIKFAEKQNVSSEVIEELKFLREKEITEVYRLAYSTKI